jgi:hypothetical protein
VAPATPAGTFGVVRGVSEHAQGCTGKLRYAAFQAARAVARFIRRSDRASHVEAYHCRHCHGFHVGEDDRRLSKRAANAAHRAAGA